MVFKLGILLYHDVKMQDSLLVPTYAFLLSFFGRAPSVFFYIRVISEWLSNLVYFISIRWRWSKAVFLFYIYLPPQYFRVPSFFSECTKCITVKLSKLLWQWIEVVVPIAMYLYFSFSIPPFNDYQLEKCKTSVVATNTISRFYYSSASGLYLL